MGVLFFSHSKRHLTEHYYTLDVLYSNLKLLTTHMDLYRKPFATLQRLVQSMSSWSLLKKINIENGEDEKDRIIRRCNGQKIYVPNHLKLMPLWKHELHPELDAVNLEVDTWLER